MPQTLQVDEGSSGKFVLVDEPTQDNFLPLNGLYLPNGSGGYDHVEVNNKSLQVAIEQWNAGALNTSIQSESAGLAQNSVLEQVRDELQSIQDGNDIVQVAVQGSLGTIEGDTSHDSTNSGDPVQIGGYATDGTPTDVDNGDRVRAIFDKKGRQRVVDENAIVASENSILIYGSDDGGSTVRVIETDANGRPQVDVQSIPAVEQNNGNGFKDVAVTNSKVEASNSAVKLRGYHVTNEATSWAYLKLYNDIASNVTIGSTEPDHTLGIPPETGATGDLHSVNFDSGLTVAATKEQGDGDNTAPDSALVVNLFYR